MVKVLVGIEEVYTRQKIIDCFKFRNQYEVEILDKNNSDQEARIRKLDFDYYWLEYEDLDFENLIECKKKLLFNSYCIRKGLIRKAQIAFYLKKYLAKKNNSNLVRYLPETYVFELDYIDYLDEALNDCFEVDQALSDNLQLENGQETKKFILKSSMTNKGAEILIFDSKKQLENYFLKRIQQSEDESLDLRQWVIQHYIDNPLLLKFYNNRKFHLRVYILAVDNLKVYVYKDILALFSLNSYKNSNSLEVDREMNLKSHITNTCYQLDDLDMDNNSQKYQDIESECVKRFWDLNLDEVDEFKNENKKEMIFDQVKECVSEIFNCLHHEPTVFQPLKNAFELYGFDFLLDENYNCYFLEANAFPDFKQTGDCLNDLIDCLFYQTISLVSDNYFGNSKISDPNKMILVYDKILDK